MALGDKLWLVTKPAGTDLISTIDGYQADNNYAIERLLSNYVRGCGVYNSSGTQITVEAGEVMVTDGSTYKFRGNTSTATDTDAAMDASSWYDIYLVGDAAATTFTVEIKKNGTSPAATHYKRISMAKTDGASNFVDFVHRNGVYTYDTSQSIASGNVGTGAWTSIDVTGFVPSDISTYCWGSSWAYGALAITNDNSVATSGDAPNVFYHTTANEAHHWEFEVLTANTLYWEGNHASNNVYIHGFNTNKL